MNQGYFVRDYNHIIPVVHTIVYGLVNFCEEYCGKLCFVVKLFVNIATIMVCAFVYNIGIPLQNG